MHRPTLLMNRWTAELRRTRGQLTLPTSICRLAGRRPYRVRILRRLAEPRALQVVSYCRRSLPQMEYLTSAASRRSPAVLSRRV